MRQRVIAELRNPNGAEAKGARYRETLQTTGFYVDRIVIVPGESAPILQSLPVRRQRRNSDGHQNAFSQAWRNLSLRWRVGFPTRPGQEHRLPPMAPHPGSRTRREERALLIVAMSSGRLFLDRGARQHCPSPLHRHAQNKSVAGLRGTIYHRTVGSVLTTCLTHRDNPSALPTRYTRNMEVRLTPELENELASR
jgi:hypothetical protein